jgi:tRNA A37 threonylcarbamoyladenosine modification protein TsaB
MEKIEFWLLDGKKEIAHYEASLAFHEGNKILTHLQKFLKKNKIVIPTEGSAKRRDPSARRLARDDKKKSPDTPTYNIQLTNIQLYNGPGSYTGIRIGRAIASALSLSWNVPIKMIK